MSLRQRFANRLHSLQEDISAGVKHLSTQSSIGNVSSSVASAVSSVVAASSPSSSPEYRGGARRCNPEAGAELLECSQRQWEEIHLANERNARMAARCDRLVAESHARYEKQWQEVTTLQMLVGQIPKINAQIEEVMAALGDLESLFGDVEIALLGLEDTIDAREMQEKQLEQRFQVAMYQERRKAEFNELKGRLRADYAKKKAEAELKMRLASKEKQAKYQRQFEKDLEKYSEGRKDGGSSSGGSGSAGATTPATSAAAPMTLLKG